MIPSAKNITSVDLKNDFPWKVFIMNVVAVAIITIGVLSSLYAGYFNPEFRTTASSLSAIINGFSTILMFVFIDPFLSVMTDDVVLGKTRESRFQEIYSLYGFCQGYRNSDCTDNAYTCCQDYCTGSRNDLRNGGQNFKN